MRQRHFAPLLLSLVLASCGSPAPSTSYTPLNPTSTASSSYPAPTASLPQSGGSGGTGGGGGDYKFNLVFVPGTDAQVRRAVEQAAARWEKVISKSIGQLKVDVALQACGNDVAYSGTVTDIMIYAGSRDIDGPGNTLAKSGPCMVNNSSKLPVVAMLIFDKADLSNLEAELSTVATHELAHSLGFGSLWNMHGLIQGEATNDPRYIGAAAKREYAAMGGILGNIPVENEGGAGTAGTHWREKSFGTELLTGYLNTGVNPLSRMSIASFQDLGYSVDFSAADPFTTTTLNTLSMQRAFNYEAQVERPEIRLVR